MNHPPTPISRCTKEQFMIYKRVWLTKQLFPKKPPNHWEWLFSFTLERVLASYFYFWVIRFLVLYLQPPFLKMQRSKNWSKYISWNIVCSYFTWKFSLLIYLAYCSNTLKDEGKNVYWDLLDKCIFRLQVNCLLLPSQPGVWFGFLNFPTGSVTHVIISLVLTWPKSNV